MSLTHEAFMHAFAVTYCLSLMIFMIATYLGLGSGFTRVTFVLLWPLYILLMVLNWLFCTMNDAICYLLANIWDEPILGDDDDDSPDAAA